MLTMCLFVVVEFVNVQMSSTSMYIERFTYFTGDAEMSAIVIVTLLKETCTSFDIFMNGFI